MKKILAFLFRRRAKASKIIAQGIRNNAGHYDGLYEGLYQTLEHPQPLCTDAYQEWCDRVALIQDPAFQEAFAARFRKTDIEDPKGCLEKHRQLLTLVNQAGIRRHWAGTTVADEEICKYYYDITGQKPQLGGSYQTIKAAWTMDGKVVEYGMVMGVNS